MKNKAKKSMGIVTPLNSLDFVHFVLEMENTTNEYLCATILDACQPNHVGSRSIKFNNIPSNEYALKYDYYDYSVNADLDSITKCQTPLYYEYIRRAMLSEDRTICGVSFGSNYNLFKEYRKPLELELRTDIFGRAESQFLPFKDGGEEHHNKMLMQWLGLSFPFNKYLKINLTFMPKEEITLVLFLKDK